jgi:hypothetical protein
LWQGCHEQGVAISGSARNGFCRKGARSTYPILYDELQPEHFAQALSGDPRNDVGIPARSIRNDNFDRLLRPTL